MSDRQGLLHHHVDVATRARLHHHGMVECAGERRDGLRLHAIQHRAKVRKENGIRQAIALRVMPVQRGVRVEDAGDLDVLALGRGA